MSDRDRLDFLHRVHILLGREKQNAIVRARFPALIDGPSEFSNNTWATRRSAPMLLREQPPRFDVAAGGAD